MRIIKLLVLTAIAALATLALAAGASTALRSIQLSQLAIGKLGSVTFSAEGAINVICEVEMTKLIVEPIPKVAGRTVGSASLAVLGQRERAERCIGGTARFLMPETALGVNYINYEGVLPNIEGIVFELLRVRVLVSALGGLAACLYEGNLRERFIVVNHRTSSLRILERPTLHLVRALTPICPEQLSVSGVLNGEAVGVTLV